MTDEQLIKVLGGVTAVARLLGITPPSVSGRGGHSAYQSQHQKSRSRGVYRRNDGDRRAGGNLRPPQYDA